MEDFTVATSELPSGAVVVKVSGQLRIQCEPLDVVLRSVLARRPSVVIFDLTDLSFASSLGMGQLVNCHRNQTLRGGVVRLAGTQPMVLDSFKRARLLDLFLNYPTVEEAANA